MHKHYSYRLSVVLRVVCVYCYVHYVYVGAAVLQFTN